MVRCPNIACIGLHVVLTCIEKLISTFCYFFSYFGVLINCRSWVWNLHNIFLRCAETVAISMFKDFWYFHLWKFNSIIFSCQWSLIWKFCNLLLDIFRCVDSACITEYLVLSYIEKSFSNVGHFFSYFLMVNKLCKLISLNYATYFRYVQKIKHCLCFRPFSVFIYGKFNSNYYLHF